MPEAHQELIPTRGSLLSRLKDLDDQESWQDFFDTYWKLIFGVAIKAGFPEEEARDIVQETVICVAKQMPGFKYNPSIGSFKTWMLNITRRRMIDHWRKRNPAEPVLKRRSAETDHTPTVERIPDPASLDLDAIWNEDWEKNLMDAAIERVKRQVKARQFQMFDLYVMKQWPIADIARTLHVNVAQIYLAKHRVSALVKKELKRLEAQASQGQ